MNCLHGRNGNENAWEQISVYQLAEFLFTYKDYDIKYIIKFIRELSEQETDLFWNEEDLVEILEKVKQ